MTTPSNSPVPSNLPQDLQFNAEKIDEAVNSSALTYLDRFNIARRTLAGATAALALANPRGAWATATAYAARDVVSNSGTWYIALDAHTSGATFAGDTAAHWRVYQGVTAVDLALSTAASLINWIAAGTGAVVRSITDKLRENVSVIDYGGVMTTSSAGVRTANSAAILAAYAVNKRVRIPAGTYWIDPNVELPVDIDLGGAGKSVTTIKGDGDLFKWTASAGLTHPRIHDMAIANDVTRGKHFRTAVGADLPPVLFERVSFLKATHHISTDDLVVGWKTLFCHFNDASVNSVAFKGAWGCVNAFGYSWFNAQALGLSGSSASTNSALDCVFEYQTGMGVRLSANGGDLHGWTFTTCHFEGNNSAGTAGVPDVQVETVTANQATGVVFDNCTFAAPNAAQTVRVKLVEGGGGFTFGTRFRGGYVAGTVPLVTSNPRCTVDNDVLFQSGSAPTGVVMPVVTLSQHQGFMGQTPRITGVAGGSGQVQATVAIPSGAKGATIKVAGNSYNGTADANSAFLMAVWRASGNRITNVLDANHTSGTNQGFVVTYSGGNLVIANKSGMTSNQSGDVIVSWDA